MTDPIEQFVQDALYGSAYESADAAYAAIAGLLSKRVRRALTKSEEVKLGMDVSMQWNRWRAERVTVQFVDRDPYSAEHMAGPCGSAYAQDEHGKLKTIKETR